MVNKLEKRTYDRNSRLALLLLHHLYCHILALTNPPSLQVWDQACSLWATACP